jgi:hypothetical protein
MEIIVLDPDKQFFAQHPDRYAHIRMPRKVLAKDNQRAVRYVDENETEFRSLGDHDHSRRRIILWRVPRDNYFYNPDNPQVLKIPFLLYADETVEDTDPVLLPIIHELMIDEAKRQKVI